MFSLIQEVLPSWDALTAVLRERELASRAKKKRKAVIPPQRRRLSAPGSPGREEKEGKGDVEDADE